MLLVALLLVRQIYPYASGLEPTVVEGYEVNQAASNLGGPTCLVWANTTHLLVCDRDGGQITELNIETDQRRTLLDGLDRPHGLLLYDERAIVSEAGRLSSYAISQEGLFENQSVLVSGITV
jgi:hypothetical protein